MEDGPTICVVCAWRATCNKKFSMDGASTTRCPEFTRDVTLKGASSAQEAPEADFSGAPSPKRFDS
jgi:hypothetical protein